MLLITCPTTSSDELVADRLVRPVADPRTRPGVVAVAVACPCGREHVYLTGRRIEEARARLAGAAHDRRADRRVAA